MSNSTHESEDLYALPADALREPPRTLAGTIRQIGPGLILASSIVGTGELINTTGLGAKAGFALLWLILLSSAIKVFVQVELGRYAITHGKTTLAAFDTLPGPKLGTSWICWLWLIMMLTTQAQIAAMEGTVGQAAHMEFPRVARAMADAAGVMVPAWGSFLATREEYVWAGITTMAGPLIPAAFLANLFRSARVSRHRRSADRRSPGDAPTVGDWETCGRRGRAGQKTLPEPAAWRSCFITSFASPRD